MKKVFAEKAKASGNDGTGVLVDVLYVCPYCHNLTGKMFISHQNDVDFSSFETDMECEYCGKKATVICDEVESMF